MRRAARTSVFCKVSALVPVELRCEMCIYITELGACSQTRFPQSGVPCLPLAPLKPGGPSAPTLQNPPSTPALFGAMFKRSSPSLRSAGGGRICLIVSVTLATLHKQRQLSH